MPVTRAQAEAAMRQLAAEFAANADRIAAVMGVESVRFEVGDTAAEAELPFWTATTRKGTTIHHAGPDGVHSRPVPPVDARRRRAAHPGRGRRDRGPQLVLTLRR